MMDAVSKALTKRRAVTAFAVSLSAVAVLLGFAISRIHDYDGAIKMLTTVSVLGAVLLSPAVYLFSVCAIGNSGFGLLALTEETGSGLIAMDVLMIAMLGSLCLGGLLWGETQLLRDKLADPRTRFLLGALALVGIWCLATVVRFDQDALLTVKAARSALYYGFGLWGLFVTLDARQEGWCVRALALGGALLSSLVVLGLFIDLEPYLPGVPRVNPYLGSSAGLHRTVPLGYEFIFLAFFLFLFCEETFSQGARALGLALTSLGTIAVGFRAYWLGITAAMLVLSIEKVARRRGGARLLRWTLIAAIAVLVFLVVTGAVDTVLNRALSIREEIGGTTGSFGIRMAQVEALLPFLKEHPLVGVGFLHAEGPQGYQIAPLGRLLIHRFGTTDVGWMDVIVRFGVLGGAAWLALFVFLYRSLRRDPPGTRPSVSLALKAMVLTGLFSLPAAALFSIPNGVLTVAMPCGLLIAAKREPRAPHRRSQPAEAESALSAARQE